MWQVIGVFFHKTKLELTIVSFIGPSVWGNLLLESIKSIRSCECKVENYFKELTNKSYLNCYRHDYYLSIINSIEITTYYYYYYYSIYKLHIIFIIILALCLAVFTIFKNSIKLKLRLLLILPLLALMYVLVSAASFLNNLDFLALISLYLEGWQRNWGISACFILFQHYW